MPQDQSERHAEALEGDVPELRLRPPVDPPPRAKPEPRRIRFRNSLIAVAGCVAVIACCLFALQSAVRRGAADALSRSLDAVDTRLALTPGSPVAWMLAGEDRTSANGLPAEGLEAFARAAEAAPRLTLANLWLAAHLEATGSAQHAEQELLEAARNDRGFLPRWALANFYLRSGAEEPFWRWIQAAVEAEPGEAAAAYALCWRAFSDPLLIQQQGVPDEPESNRRYFRFLAARKSDAGLRLLWPRFSRHAQPADLPAIAIFLDELLHAGNAKPALEVWNDVCERGLAPHEPLAPDSGIVLTNGDFSHTISGYGFDWRLPPAQGVDRVQRAAQEGPAVEFRLSGSQPENLPLLQQITPVVPGERYRLDYEFATQRLPAATGVGWVISEHPGGAVVAESGSLPAAEDFWDESSLELRAPDDARLLRLELRYLPTSSGAARQMGRFVLRKLSLEPLDQQAGPAR